MSSAELETIDPSRKKHAVALPDGGYYGTLSVYHELHCLVRKSQNTYIHLHYSTAAHFQKLNAMLLD